MSRFIQADHNDKPEKATKKEKPVLKAGMKGYDYNDLGSGRKIPTKDGFK